MRWLLRLVEVGGIIIGMGLLLRHPAHTDGLEWAISDSCGYILVDKLPFSADRPFEKGDRLLRIDYMPACSLGMPPRQAETTLFLYEVLRGEEKYLLFAEFWPYPALGWFRGRVGLGVGLGLLLIFFAGGLLLGQAIRKLRRYVETGTRFWMALGWFLGVCGLVGGWIYGSYYREVNGWMWALVGALGLGWVFWRVEAGLGAALLAGGLAWGWPSYAGWVVGAVLGGMGFWLKGVWKGAYWPVWLLWTYTYEPGWLLGLVGIIAGNQFYPFLRNVYKVLTLRERFFYLLGFMLGGVAAVGIANPIGELRGLRLLGGGFGGGVVGWLSVEGLHRLYQRRRRAQRRHLLERDIPLLWEVADVGSLERRVQELLKAYWDVEWAQIGQALGPQRLWLKRQGESPPLPEWNKENIEAAIPLGEPYWLLIGRVRSPLTLEDITWLERFGRYVGISRRHLALYEAAHEARLQALRHQLSPHFLFNALHTLQGLLYEDTALAEKLLSRLGQLLRRSLELAKHLLIPLTEELALVHDYLEIEKQRYGQRLVIRWEVPSPLPEALIPPFTIQTLIENAIKHAVAKQMHPTTLHLQVSCKGETLQVLVADDGPGFRTANPSPGIGLTNLRTRLEHIYGAKAQLSITQGERRGVQVLVTLPLFPPDHGRTLPDRNQNRGAAPSLHD
jgi:hypothetical protein